MDQAIFYKPSNVIPTQPPEVPSVGQLDMYEHRTDLIFPNLMNKGSCFLCDSGNVPCSNNQKTLLPIGAWGPCLARATPCPCPGRVFVQKCSEMIAIRHSRRLGRDNLTGLLFLFDRLWPGPFILHAASCIIPCMRGTSARPDHQPPDGLSNVLNTSYRSGLKISPGPQAKNTCI